MALLYANKWIYVCGYILVHRIVYAENMYVCMCVFPYKYIHIQVIYCIIYGHSAVRNYARNVLGINSEDTIHHCLHDCFNSATLDQLVSYVHI